MKHFLQSLLLLCCAVAGFNGLHAQVSSSYGFSQSTVTYTPITGGTVLGTAAIDDTGYPNLSIGFPFTYNGIPQASFSVNANGFIAFGATIASSYTALSTGTSNNVVAAHNYDLQGLATGEIRYEVIGTAPNRALVVQWTDFASYQAALNAGDEFDFQIILYETTNAVQVVYGPSLKNATARLLQVGLRGNTNADFNNRTTTTDWAATVAGATNTATITYTQAVCPTPGLAFTWLPVSFAVSNIVYAPTTQQCVGVPHTVTADITDPIGITNAQVNYTINGVAQTPIPMTLVTGDNLSGNWTATIPATTGPQTQNVVFSIGVTGGNGITGAVQGGAYIEYYLGLNAGPDQVLGVGLTTTLSATANDPSLFPVLITEVTQFETGQGPTTPYPAFVPTATIDYDGLELSNIHATNPANIGGLQIVIWSNAVTSFTYTIPAGTTIPPASVAVFALNTVASNPANLFFGMNSGLSPGSGTPYGYVLRTANGTVIDAVATTGFTFPAASGVTAANWSGNIPSSTGRAGVIRNVAADNNLASDWVISATGGPFQTVGSFNPNVATINTAPGAFIWNPGALSGQQISVGPFAPGSYTYTVEYTDALGCSSTDAVTIVIPNCPAPTAFQASNPTDSTVTLSWVSGGGTVDSTLIIYGPTGFTPGNGDTVLATGNPYTLTGLLPNSIYQAYVYESCDPLAGTSFLTGPISFTTFCSPFPLPGNGAANAIVAGAFPFTDTVSTATCYGDNSPLRVGADVFYAFTADSCATSITVSLCGSSLDNYLYIRNAANTTTIGLDDDGCNDPASPNASELTFTPVPGTTYLAVLEPFGAGVTGTYVINITQQLGLVNPTLNTVTSNPTCPGVSNGSATVTATGAIAYPVTYLWSNGDTTATTDSLAVGAYTVTVTNGCGGSATATVTLTNQYDVATVVTPVSCNGGANGAINLTVSGGVAPFTFAWSNASTDEDLSGLSAGAFSVTATDATGCTATATATVTQPDSIAAVLDSLNDVSCFGGTDGAINVSLTGGAVFQYTQNVNIANPALALNNTFNFANVPVGADAILIVRSRGDIDGNAGNLEQWIINDEGGLPLGTIGGSGNFADQCTVTPLQDTIFITAAQLATWAANGTVTFTGVGTNNVNVTLCGVGQDFLQLELIINVNFTYAWSNGATTEDISGLAPGTYTLTATDGNGCVFVSPAYTVNEPTALAVALDSTGNASCFNGTNGFIAISVSGGTAPYTFNWSNGSTTEDLNAIGAGNYTGTVTDANGCSLVAGPVAITHPTALVVGLDSLFNVSCNGGNDGGVYINISGGTAPYTFNWSNGSTDEDVVNAVAGAYTGTITDANGCTIVGGPVPVSQPTAIALAVDNLQNVACFGDSTGAILISVSGGTAPYAFNWSNGSTSEDITGLPAGAYTGTITDANGCVLVAGPVDITQADPFFFALTADDVVCFGDSTGIISLSVGGGVAPYSYSWSNGDTTATLFNLPVGTYFGTVTDANGCVFESGGIAIGGPVTPISVAVDSLANTLSCNGDSTGLIAITVSDGIAPYTFSWSNGATDEDLANLPEGAYTGTITDANGCVLVAGPIDVIAPAPFNIGLTFADVSCNGAANGGISLFIGGGTAPYNYLWSNGDTTSSIGNLSPGTYDGTVTDANGCSFSAGGIQIVEPTPIGIMGISITNVSCFGGNDGSVDIQIDGGVQPYTYLWSNGATDATITGLTAGLYDGTVTDATGCTFTGTLPISEPTAIAIALTTTDATANGAADGTATAVVQGGTAPYTYLWSNGGTGASINNLVAGTYTLTVTDANGCILIDTDTVSQPPVSIAQIEGLNSLEIFPNPTNGVLNIELDLASVQDVTISVISATGQIVKPFETRSLNAAQINLDLTDLPAGVYMVRFVIGNQVITKSVALTK